MYVRTSGVNNRGCESRKISNIKSSISLTSITNLHDEFHSHGGAYLVDCLSIYLVPTATARFRREPQNLAVVAGTRLALFSLQVAGHQVLYWYQAMITTAQVS